MLDETSLMISAQFTQYIVSTVIFGLTAYRAFKLRAVLRNKFSRSHALWLVVIATAQATVLWTPFPFPNSLVDLVYGILVFGVFPIVIVAWVDGAVRAARRSDPLYRDSLAWTKLRVITYAATLAAAALNFGLFALVTLTGLPVPAFSEVLVIAPLLPPFLAGAPALLLVARRTRSAIRRTNAKWFALYYLFQLASIVTYVVTVSGTSDPQLLCGCILNFLAFHGIYALGWNVVTVTFVISGYCLYRYVRSLAQLNRLPLSDEAERPDVEANE